MPPGRIPLDHRRLDPETMWARAEAFRAEVSRRRTVRDFSSEPVPRRVIESCLATLDGAADRP